MKTTRLALLLALAAGCGARVLPGTDIRDTRDTRAIYGIIDQWVRGMNNRDAGAVLALVSPEYFDDGGTPDPADDLDRERLERALVDDFARVEGAKLSVTIRRIDVEGDAATAELFYDNYYRVQTPAGAIPRRDSDVYRLRMKKTGGEWKVIGGL